MFLQPPGIPHLMDMIDQVASSFDLFLPLPPGHHAGTTRQHSHTDLARNGKPPVLGEKRIAKHASSRRKRDCRNQSQQRNLTLLRPRSVCVSRYHSSVHSCALHSSCHNSPGLHADSLCALQCPCYDVRHVSLENASPLSLVTILLVLLSRNLVSRTIRRVCPVFPTARPLTRTIKLERRSKASCAAA